MHAQLKSKVLERALPKASNVLIQSEATTAIIKVDQTGKNQEQQTQNHQKLNKKVDQKKRCRGDLPVHVIDVTCHICHMSQQQQAVWRQQQHQQRSRTDG